MGNYLKLNVRSSAFDKRIEEAEVQVPAGLELCLPTVYRSRFPLLPRFHLATQHGIQLRTLVLKRPIFISATICDNHGRLQNPGISSACGVRSQFSPIARQIARLLFFWTCTSTRSERTRAEALEARSARKGMGCLITIFHYSREYPF